MTVRIIKLSVLASAVAALALSLPLEKSPERIVAEGFSCLLTPAHAVVGRPLTPVSYAGVARRTSRRTTRRVVRRY